jgi:gas vesicle protein
MQEKKTNGKAFVIGAIIGGVVGSVGALLFAPKSGRELRKDIAEQVEAVSDKTQEVAKTVGSKSREVAKVVTTQTSEWASKTKSAAQTIVSDVKSWGTAKEAPAEVAATLEEQETVRVE